MNGLLPLGINVLASILGIIAIGSIFAIISNSTIDRIPKNQSVIYPGPYCKSCAAKLLWKDIIPIWSYFNSGGKCPYCGNPIPLRNLIVDIAEIIWVAVFIVKFGWSFQALFEMMFGVGLIAVIVIEKENRQLSDLILLLLGMLSAIYLLAFNPQGFPSATISFFLGGGILLAYNILKQVTKIGSRINFSEIKFGAILGLFMGFQQVILCVFLALFTGAVMGTYRIKFLGRNHQRAVPEFPILMAAAGLVVIMFGQEILTIYRQLMV